ncbi:MAG TPA: thioredoxin domain-containing protein [Myxococcota bacterium]|nr:thioredoxin domain-containing protein [Myxococcota bacterium]
MSQPEGRAATQANRLARETSAYLRQHMHNPVDWYAWGPEAFDRARNDDKPLLISIGYSACHWCHVMERESFEDSQTAALMNRLFVNIKVDREERPDVDQIYMDTVVRLTGHGGWPLTVFCTPDGRPYYGGTYFPPEAAQGRASFRQVLEAVERAFRTQRDEVERSAASILAALRQRPSGVATEPPGTHNLRTAASELLSSADALHGGFGAAPKFPTPTNLDLLTAALDVLPPEDSRAVLDFLGITCREMSRRGLYDQLGGGFHRYCVDAEWTIPHFEKMLYDQGQLLRTYAEVWRRRGASEDDLLWPIRETAEYLRREMTGPEGGYFASQDADSEGVEGKFFVWTPGQIEAVLGRERASAFCKAYAVTEAGNFEHGTTQLIDVARRPRAEFAAERRELLAARAKRVPPATDQKRVAAWNGLAISGLARAASLLGDAAMLADGAAAADFVLTRMRSPQGQLLRVFAEGRSQVPAFLDDLAAILEACLDLYRAGAGERFLRAATGFATDIAERFFDEAEGDLFFTPKDAERLVYRPRSDHDGATPHSTGHAVLGLLRASALCGRPDLGRVAQRVIRAHAFMLERAPAAFPTLIRAAHLAERGVSVAVVVGEPDHPLTRDLLARARQVLLPEDAVLGIAPSGPAPFGVDPAWLSGRVAVDGKPTVYVCHGTTCSLPVTQPEALLSALERSLP